LLGVGFRLSATFLKTFYALSTIPSTAAPTSSEYLPMKALRIFEKIMEMESLPRLAYVKKLKCLYILLVSALLPPPGGPMAETKTISSILMNGFSF
jgi:hypothetical protein